MVVYAPPPLRKRGDVQPRARDDAVRQGSVLHPASRSPTGAGYGIRTLAWEDDLGAWAKVADRSFKGLAAECGLAYSFNRLIISAGCSTVRFGYTDLVFGLGWRF
jgi:hypothetical protein